MTVRYDKLWSLMKTNKMKKVNLQKLQKYLKAQ